MSNFPKVAARVLMAGLVALLAAPGKGRATEGAMETAAQERTAWAWSPSVLL